MLKAELFKEFQKNPDKHWKVQLFEKEGFKRKVCPICGKGFWSLVDKENCPEHDYYGFIGTSVAKSKWDLLTAWKEFQNYFYRNKHTPMKRYPLVSRWHPTLYFTIASIQDFIRFDASGLNFEYPHNPLLVPQLCLRFNDIANVGVTGKHMTCFIMAGQHAFSDRSGKGYWKDECMELDFNYFTQVMKLPKEELVYVEDFWAMPDLLAFGPTIEAHSRGLELVNHVFMEFGASNSGYKELPIKVNDTGWGFERIPWFSQGTPTIYDVAFGPVVNQLIKVTGVDYDKQFFNKYANYAGSLNIDEVADIKIARQKVAKELKVSTVELDNKIAPIEAIYAIADHSRALGFAIADGALPSNVAGGYNLRVILRRALSFIDKFGWQIKLHDVVRWHAKYLEEIFPELGRNIEIINKVLDIEERRYETDVERSKKIIDTYKGRKISGEDLQKLYTSQGITPEELGLEAPSGFYKNLTEKHQGEKLIEDKWHFDVSNVSDTKILYYEYPVVYNFDARVLRTFDDGKFVVLDQTAFYPTSGGQLHDTGTINGIDVIDVQKIKNVIVHELGQPLKDSKAIGKIDKSRREKLTKHHTATHIINAAARKILGNHVWQVGSEKEVDKARLDITHYESLTDSDVEKIEDEANSVIGQNLPVTEKILPRMEAEEKYGFTIYQGGAIPLKYLRIVSIGNIDNEADGGTHVKTTGEVDGITILRTKRIQDGVVRIEYAAGDVAVSVLKEKEKILKEAAWKLGVKEEKVPEAVEKLFSDWKKERKK